MSHNVLPLTHPPANDSTSPGPAQSDDPEHGLVLRQMLRPLAQYLEDDSVREIAIPAPGLLFLRIGGAWHERSDPTLTFSYMEALAAAMASFNEGAGFRSIMSLKLLDGMRGQVMLPPVTLEGSVSLNIRKHSDVVKTLDELNEEGAFDFWRDVSGAIQAPEQLTPEDQELLQLKESGEITSFLDRAVKLRKNIIVSGATGSGKTTFARSLIERVPTTERLITIEDVHELFLPDHPNKVHLFYGDGEGQASPTACVAACMRSSPDRIFLSELRGPEAWDYLQALNTGHPGSVTTTHANHALDTFNRVTLLIKQSESGNQIDVETLRQLLLSTLDIVLFFANYKLVEVYFNPERAHTLI